MYCMYVLVYVIVRARRLTEAILRLIELSIRIDLWTLDTQPYRINFAHNSTANAYLILGHTYVNVCVNKPLQRRANIHVCLNS